MYNDHQYKYLFFLMNISYTVSRFDQELVIFRGARDLKINLLTYLLTYSMQQSPS